MRRPPTNFRRQRLLWSIRKEYPAHPRGTATWLAPCVPTTSHGLSLQPCAQPRDRTAISLLPVLAKDSHQVVKPNHASARSKVVTIGNKSCLDKAAGNHDRGQSP